MEDVKRKLLLTFLNNAKFDGFNEKTLQNSCKELGLDEYYYLLFFPQKLDDVVHCFHQYMDEVLQERLTQEDFSELKIREKIQRMVELRLELMEEYKTLLPKMIAHNLLNLNTKESFDALWNTAHIIWKAAGDKSTDYNYYTKRTLLVYLYSSTVMFWLDDNSEDYRETKEFIADKIEEILKLGKLNIKENIMRMKNKIPFIRTMDF